MILRSVFFILFFASCFSSIGQQKPWNHIQFQDYEKCAVGLISAEGDTVFPAIYDACVKRGFGKTRYWELKIGGKFGIMNDLGEEWMPIEYDGYSFMNDSVIRTLQNEKYGLIDTRAKVTIPAVYETMYHNYWGGYFLFGSYKKLGMMDSNYNIVVHPDYYSVRSITPNDVSPEMRDSMTCFVAIKNGKYGVINVDASTKIPFVYDRLIPQFIGEPCSTNRIYFYVQDSIGCFGFIDNEGQTVVPIIYDHVGIHYSQRHACDDSIQIVASGTLNNTVVKSHNISNGKSSEFYDRIQYFEGLSIAFKGDSSWILDENYNKIHTPINGEYLFGAGKKGYPNWNPKLYLNTYSNHGGLRRFDSIVYVGDELIKERKRRRYKKVKASVMAIENYHTGASTPKAFNKLQVRRTEGNNVIWAYDYNGDPIPHDRSEKNKKVFHLTIYNRSLDTIGTLAFNQFVRTEFGGEWDNYYDKRPYYFRNELNKYGAIDINGKVTVPFEYDVCTRLGSWYDNEAQKQIVLINVAKNGKYGIINRKGEIVTPLIYDMIKGSVGTKGDSTYIFDHYGKVYSVELTQQPRAKKSAKPNYVKHKKSKKKKKPKYTKPKKTDEGLKVIDSLLYFYRGEDYLVKQDSSNNRFNKKWLSLGDYIINEQGKVLYEGKHWIRKDYSPYSFIQEKKHGYFIDSLGNIGNTFKEKIYNINYYGRYAQIEKRKTNQYGIYDLITETWLFELGEYAYVNAATKGTDHVFWVELPRKRKQYQDIWHLLDSNKEQILPYDLDYHGYMDEESKMVVFESHGLQGLLDSNYNVLIPLDSVSISEFQEFITIEEYTKSDRSKLFNGMKYLKGEFDKIIYPTGTNAIILQRDDEYALIDRDLNYLKNYQSESDFLNSIDLYDILDLQGSIVDSNYLKIKSFLVNKNETRFKNMLIWNRIIKPEVKTYTGFDSVWVYNPYKRKRMNMRVSTSTRITGSSSILLGNYLTEEISTDTTVIALNYRWSSPGRGLKTYHLENGTIKQVSINDLLLPGMEEKLDKLIIKELNRLQAYGITCVNLEAEIENLKQNFQLETLGIAFFEPGFKYRLTIPFEELEGVIVDLY